MTAIIVALITTAGVIAVALINRSAILQAARRQPAVPTREDVLHALAAIVDDGQRARATIEIDRTRPGRDDVDVDKDAGRDEDAGRRAA